VFANNGGKRRPAHSSGVSRGTPRTLRTSPATTAIVTARAAQGRMRHGAEDDQGAGDGEDRNAFSVVPRRCAPRSRCRPLPCCPVNRPAVVCHDRRARPAGRLDRGDVIHVAHHHERWRGPCCARWETDAVVTGAPGQARPEPGWAVLAGRPCRDRMPFRLMRQSGNSRHRQLPQAACEPSALARSP
jgi:hypothetical protein